ncbi:MAG: carboxypeptidase regulatory-like domain-containing protein [Candidatus Thermoplasmatota archaeon]|nr:carboxypeptidase regulatory-like domain-containing protein [Candidatus Thermoplasmatota archaeon]
MKKLMSIFKTFMGIGVVLLLLLSSYAGSMMSDKTQETITTSCHIRITDPAAPTLVNTLSNQGYDILPNTLTDTSFELIVTPQERTNLDTMGIIYEIIEIGGPLAIPPGYLDYTDIVDEMIQFATDYPSICKFYDLTDTYSMPDTYEGRHLYALKISDNVLYNENEPAFLMVSCHHAREIVTPVIALYSTEQLLSNYGSDPTITDLIDEYEIWIAPVWNPDGYEHVFYYDNMWRKNRFPPDGVDLNRNYPFGWDSAYAGSTDPYSETYKGPSAGSEVETQTMMAFSDDRHFVKVMDYHSSGQEVLYGYVGLTHPFESFMYQEAVQISIAAGYGGSVRDASAMGENYQWQIYGNGSYANLMETHTSFQPSYASALSESAQIFPSTIYILQRPISISGVVTDYFTGDPIVADIVIDGVTFTNSEYFMSEPRFGRYHFIIPPGTYTMEFSAPGYLTQSHTFTVTTSSAEIKNIQLRTPNVGPDIPTIHGPLKPRAGIEYSYTFCGTDPDIDDLEYFVMWGDGNYSDWVGPYTCNTSFELSHSWVEDGQRFIRCKSRDPSGVESDWARMEIEVPYTHAAPHSFPILQRFPILWRILQFFPFF